MSCRVWVYDKAVVGYGSGSQYWEREVRVHMLGMGWVGLKRAASRAIRGREG